MKEDIQDRQAPKDREARGVTGAHHCIHVEPTTDQALKAVELAVVVNPDASAVVRLQWAMGQLAFIREIADIVNTQTDSDGPATSLASAVYTAAEQLQAVLESVHSDLLKAEPTPTSRLHTVASSARPA